jgi:hypothetical protein
LAERLLPIWQHGHRLEKRLAAAGKGEEAGNGGQKPEKYRRLEWFPLQTEVLARDLL